MLPASQIARNPITIGARKVEFSDRVAEQGGIVILRDGGQQFSAVGVVGDQLIGAGLGIRHASGQPHAAQFTHAECNQPAAILRLAEPFFIQSNIGVCGPLIIEAGDDGEGDVNILGLLQVNPPERSDRSPIGSRLIALVFDDDGAAQNDDERQQDADHNVDLWHF